MKIADQAKHSFISLKKWIRKCQFKYRDKFINIKNRARLKNKDFTIISSDCTAGVIYKDLNLPFNSPTINMFISAQDYLKFINNMEHYFSLEMLEDPIQNQTWPVARLGDLQLQLVHYGSIEEAREKWERRKQRINWNNIYFVMNDRNGCTEDEIKQFNQFEYENKVCFTHKKWNQYNSTFHLRRCDAGGMVKPVMNFTSVLSLKRYYDQFDYVTWFNTGL